MVIGGLSPNLLDGLLVLVLGYVLVRGWRQGAASQLAALGGAVLGLLVGLWAVPPLVGLVTEGPGPQTALLTLGGLLLLVLLGQAAGVGIGLRLHHAFHRVGIATADRVAGLGVGAAGLVLVVWLLASVLGQGPFPGVAQQVRESEIVRALDARLPPAPDVVGRISTYLDEQGFPQVFAGPQRGITAGPVAPTADAAVAAAAAAGQPSTVQVRAAGCGNTLGSGSGFVTQDGFVVTNAHVVAGFGQLTVRDQAGEHPAVPIHYDPEIDVAVLAAPGTQAPSLGWTGSPAGRGTEGVTLGFPGGQTEMVVRPATVANRITAVGRDIMGSGRVERDVLVVTAPVQRGDSGGPFVTADGLVGGVVFAGEPGAGGDGYVLSAEQVRPGVEAGIARGAEVGVGSCRF